jgi:tRNA(adenine34) deaminase
MSADWADEDVLFMQAALAEAQLAADQNEIPVGGVVVVGGEIIGRGGNRSVTDHDPSGHAEIVALRAAGSATGNYRLVDATLYVTLEPCAMCVGALIHARIRRLVFGAYDDKAGAVGSVLDLAGERKLNHRFEVNGGLLLEECGELLSAFFADRRDCRAY